MQLVEYESFKELGMRELALEVLGEVPDQFVDYMVMKESEEDYIHSAMYKGKNPHNIKPANLLTPVRAREDLTPRGGNILEQTNASGNVLYQTTPGVPSQITPGLPAKLKDPEHHQLRLNDKYTSEPRMSSGPGNDRKE